MHVKLPAILSWFSWIVSKQDDLTYVFKYIYDQINRPALIMNIIFPGKDNTVRILDQYSNLIDSNKTQDYEMITSLNKCSLDLSEYVLYITRNPNRMLNIYSQTNVRISLSSL